MKTEDEVKTKMCSQCKGLGSVKRVYNINAIELTTQCPICDGYGFVIIVEK